jgi:N-acyl-D-amino-acid deacylase
LARIQLARASGLEITHDQYVYTASSTGISQLVPEWARAGENGEFARRINNPPEKARIITEMKERLKAEKRDDYSYAVIADYGKDRSLNGKAIPQAVRFKYGWSDLDSQIDLILEIHSKGGASAVFHGMSEADMRQFLGHTNTAFASDSGVRKFQEGVPHPRGYGNNARVLARYVRELKLLSLEEAIRKMTSLPAEILQIQDCGTIRVGNRADIVVFDPEKVRDLATFEDPHHYATGLAAVLVNGVMVVKNDQHTRARPGQAIRHQP